MEPEQQRWEALQFHLSASREARDVGDRDQALEHLDAALAIDPDFLAAHMLRLSLSAPQESENARPDEFAQPTVAPATPPGSIDRPPFLAPRSLGGGKEGYAQLEARVRQRRIELCLGKARQAIAEHRLLDAEEALDEVKELDPLATGRDDLAAELAALRPVANDWDRVAAVDRKAVDDRLAVDDRIPEDDRLAVDDRIPEDYRLSIDDRIAEMPLADRIAVDDVAGDRTAAVGRRGAWIAAAALLVGVAVFAAWPRSQQPETVGSPPIENSAPVVAPTAPAQTAEAFTPPAPIAVEPETPASPLPSPPVAAPLPSPPVAAPPPPPSPVMPRPDARETDIGPPASAPVAPPPEARQPVRELPPRIADRPIPLTVIPERGAEPDRAASPAPEPPPAVAPLPRPIEPVATPPPAPAPAATAAPLDDDAALVRDTLQRYRRAYSGLDAKLAHAVYPVLDEAALTSAFATLRSQTLEFDSCSIDVRGESARAVCRGSARYVPSIGSRTPRTERRVWTFTLEKKDRDWTIANARTER